MPEQVHMLTQRRFLRGSQVFTIEKNILKAERRRGLSLEEYRFDLRGFLAEPLRIKRIPIIKLAFSIIITLLLALVWLGAIRATNDGTFSLLAGFGIGLLITLLIVVVKTCQDFTNVILFQGPGGQVTFWPNRPHEEEVASFVTTLSQSIRETEDREQYLIRQLRLAEIINDWQYDQAMELVRQHKERFDAP